MDFDYGVIIGLIVTVCGAGVLGLSYLGVYFMGHSRGRREAEREQRVLEHDLGYAIPPDRVEAIEGALSTMAQAIERLTDAQRIALLDRMRATPESRLSGGRTGQRNTPA
jgi:hypothetical protein